MSLTRKAILLAVATLLCCAFSIGTHVLAMFAPGSDAPLDRLVGNLQKYLNAHPNDPRATYLLGRVNAMAFTEKTETLHAFQFEETEAANKLPDLQEITWRDPNGKIEMLDEDRHKHLADAIRYYREAVKLAPRTGLYHLSLASIIEAAGDEILLAGTKPDIIERDSTPSTEEEIDKSVDELKICNDDERLWRKQRIVNAGADSLPLLRKLMQEKDEKLVAFAKDVLKDIWIEEAIEHYWLAYMLSVKKDVVDREEYSLSTPTSEEAAEHYLALIQKRGVTDHEKLRIPQVQHDLKQLQSRGRAVTPIIFSESEALPLDALLSADRVRFDIDGNDIPDDVAWVKPTTSILVWDPHHEGRITSGRQLFGSVTWWLFWTDGYEALTALDDNGDGVLNGQELRGLGVWRDANGNGVSEPGEVVPIEFTQIESIAVNRTSVESPGSSPANLRGLRMKDGRVLPTYDWTFDLKR